MKNNLIIPLKTSNPLQEISPVEELNR